MILILFSYCNIASGYFSWSMSQIPVSWYTIRVTIYLYIRSVVFDRYNKPLSMGLYYILCAISTPYTLPDHLHLHTNLDTYHPYPTHNTSQTDLYNIQILNFGILTTFFVVPPYQISFLTRILRFCSQISSAVYPYQFPHRHHASSPPTC